MKGFFHDSVWTVRDMRIALPARTISTAGTGLTMAATLLLIHNRGLGPYGVAALIACLSVPGILTMAIAGRVADRVDSRIVLVITAAAQAAGCLALAAQPSALMIYAMTVVISLAQSFAQPTWSALIPRAAGEDKIGPAIAWQRGLNAVASPVGFALGGLLVGLGQVRWGFLGDAGTYLLLATAALGIQTRRHISIQPQLEGVGRGSWRDALATTARDRLVWPLFITIVVFVILVEGINPVEVFLVRDALGASSLQFGLSEFFSGAGVILGSVIAGRIRTANRRAQAAAIGFGSAASSLIIAGLAPNYWVYATMLIGLMAGSATFGALLVGRTPDQDRGKVFAALGGLSQTASILALAAGSTVLSITTPRITFIAAGIGGVLLMIITTIRITRAIPQTTDPDHQPERQA